MKIHLIKFFFIFFGFSFQMAYASLVNKDSNLNCLIKDMADRSASDSCKITYKLQIIRDLDTSNGSVYLVEFDNQKQNENDSIKFLWQNQMRSTFEIINCSATIKILQVTLPNNRIVHVVLDQRALINITCEFGLDFLISEELFPKNKFILMKLCINLDKRKVTGRLRPISSRNYEKYKLLVDSE